MRPSANVTCWPVQEQLERDFAAAVEALGRRVRRAHPVDAEKGHGFIDGQRMGIEVFNAIPPDAPLVVVEAVWQYSHHVLAGLRSHRGPILVVANWSGQWPGLVGMLNLIGSLTKAGVAHSALWSEDFTDDWARDGLRTWLETGRVAHDTGHVRDLDDLAGGPEVDLGDALAAQLCARRPSSASSTRAAWGCTTRSSTTSCSTRWGSTRSGCRRARSSRRWARCPTPRPRPSGPGWTRPAWPSTRAPRRRAS